MPGFATHHLFGHQTLKKNNNENLKQIIYNNIQAFNLGLQGPDLFFYFLPSNIGIGPDIAGIMHKKLTGRFFKNLIVLCRTIKSKKSFNTAVAYIMGFMGHYILDCELHPYIYYRAGHEKTLKNLGRHFALESDIDKEFLWHYRRLKPQNFSHSEAIMLSPAEKNVISGLLSDAVHVTYNIKLSPWYVKLSIACFYKEAAALNDPEEKKYRLWKKMEHLFFGAPFLSPLFINNLTRTKDACNLRKNIWYNPWARSRYFNHSVPELFFLASKKYASYMNHMYKALITGNDHTILKYLKSNSYNSGL